MKKLAAASSLLFLLCACGQKAAPTPDAGADLPATASAGDAAEARERAAAERRQADVDAAAAKRRDSYRARLVPLLTGSYAGSCQIARAGDGGQLTPVGGAPVRDRAARRAR
jgi:hypothetical protein